MGKILKIVGNIVLNVNLTGYLFEILMDESSLLVVTGKISVCFVVYYTYIKTNI